MTIINKIKNVCLFIIVLGASINNFYMVFYICGLLMGDPFIDNPWWYLPTFIITILVYLITLVWSITTLGDLNDKIIAKPTNNE